MDAAQALSELRELSSQVERAVIVEAGGEVLAGTDGDSVDQQALAGTALALVAAAEDLHGTTTEATRVEIELADGAMFVLREQGRTIAGTTGPNPTSGLVVYDLRTCLHLLQEKPKRTRASRKTKESEQEQAADEGGPEKTSAA